MEPNHIAERCAKVGLQRKKLAELAELDEDTVTRTLNGKTGPLHETMQKLRGALVGYEIDLLAHLAKLHPKLAMQHATVALCPEPNGSAGLNRRDVPVGASTPQVSV